MSRRHFPLSQENPMSKAVYEILQNGGANPVSKQDLSKMLAVVTESLEQLSIKDDKFDAAFMKFSRLSENVEFGDKDRYGNFDEIPDAYSPLGKLGGQVNMFILGVTDPDERQLIESLVKQKYKRSQEYKDFIKKRLAEVKRLREKYCNPTTNKSLSITPNRREKFQSRLLFNKSNRNNYESTDIISDEYDSDNHDQSQKHDHSRSSARPNYSNLRENSNFLSQSTMTTNSRLKSTSPSKQLRANRRGNNTNNSYNHRSRNCNFSSNDHEQKNNTNSNNNIGNNTNNISNNTNVNRNKSANGTGSHHYQSQSGNHVNRTCASPYALRKTCESIKTPLTDQAYQNYKYLYKLNNDNICKLYNSLLTWNISKKWELNYASIVVIQSNQTTPTSRNVAIMNDVLRDCLASTIMQEDMDTLQDRIDKTITQSMKTQKWAKFNTRKYNELFRNGWVLIPQFCNSLWEMWNKFDKSQKYCHEFLYQAQRAVGIINTAMMKKDRDKIDSSSNVLTTTTANSTSMSNTNTAVKIKKENVVPSSISSCDFSMSISIDDNVSIGTKAPVNNSTNQQYVHNNHCTMQIKTLVFG